MADWNALGLDVPVSVNIDAMAVAVGRRLQPQRLSAPLAIPVNTPGARTLAVPGNPGNQRAEDIASGVRHHALPGPGRALCIDDFGTGYPRSPYPGRLGAEEIKIDQSLKSDTLVDPDDWPSCRA